MKKRSELLLAWLKQQLAAHEPGITLLAGDASTRRYHRVYDGVVSYILVESPVDQNNNQGFIAISSLFKAHGVRVPNIYAHSLEHGFFLLEDLGDQQLLSVLNENTADKYYEMAMQELIKLQKTPLDYSLPVYNEVLLKNELSLFQTWYLERHLGLKLNVAQQRCLDQVVEELITSAMAQPNVIVHRDYHSRNLMVADSAELAVIDFQDAVIGPVTYDIVSLLRDCYIKWSDEEVSRWLLWYKKMAVEAGIIDKIDNEKFMRFFDLMGLQRHLKVLGVFSRLHYKDGKSAYLKDLPMVMGYVMTAMGRYPEFEEMRNWLLEVVSAHRVSV